jgi:NAD(P)-dependent dehydrogenase (short-subunit alcohol dehydrogenase family)
MKVQNKTIVVTGGGSGIGRDLVLALLAKGARVAAVDINETTLQETAELAGSQKAQLSTHVVDITDKTAVYALRLNFASYRHRNRLHFLHQFGKLFRLQRLGTIRHRLFGAGMDLDDQTVGTGGNGRF